MPEITTTRRRTIPQQVKEYKHYEVLRQWYELPTVLLSNVTSLTNKLEEVITASKSTSADIVEMTEAWQIIPENCGITGYPLFHRLRTEKRSGDLVFYCRSHLQPTLFPVEPF